MDLTVQAQLLGALQREGLCQTPCRGGEPHSPHPAPTHPHGPKEELSLLQQFGATTRYSQYEENTQKGALCTVSDQPLAHYRQTWVIFYAQLHHLISTDLSWLWVKSEKNKIFACKIPQMVCTGKTREHPAQPSNWKSSQKMQKG